MTEPIYQTGVLIGKICIASGYDDYEGDYTITPSFSQQMLPTEDKHLTQNLIIKPIPYLEELNPSGGKTIIIGG